MLKDYTRWCDYRKHDKQTATIIEEYEGDETFNFKIEWNDGETSSVKKDNLLTTSWKNRMED